MGYNVENCCFPVTFDIVFPNEDLPGRSHNNTSWVATSIQSVLPVGLSLIVVPGYYEL